MAMGLVARKVGMTRIFADDGSSIPVTVLSAAGNRVVQVKTPERDGYAAVQVGFGTRRLSRVTKPLRGHFAKAGVEPAAVLREFRVTVEELGRYQPGDTLGVNLFQVGQKVDVTGRSIGKGFAGVIKRHNFSSNRASHGNSITTNAPGSIGSAQDPGRVFPGKRMAGHLGNERVTIQNLEVVRIDEERQLLWVKGSVPGAPGCAVMVRPAVKARR
ncbi:MAG: 50S ribosomal protein L3 [Hydrogenophilus sp.]|nr:50S ribosomal protein L3 [Hydrogenophilus sp.]